MHQCCLPTIFRQMKLTPHQQHPQHVTLHQKLTPHQQHPQHVTLHQKLTPHQQHPQHVTLHQDIHNSEHYPPPTAYGRICLIICYYSLLRGRDSSVGVVTRLWATRSRVWILAVARDFSFCQNIHTDSGLHHTYYSMGTRDLSNVEVKNGWSDTSTSYAFKVCRGTTLPFPLCKTGFPCI